MRQSLAAAIAARRRPRARLPMLRARPELRDQLFAREPGTRPAAAPTSRRQ